MQRNATAAAAAEQEATARNCSRTKSRAICAGKSRSKFAARNLAGEDWPFYRRVLVWTLGGRRRWLRRSRCAARFLLYSPQDAAAQAGPDRVSRETTS